MIKVKVSELSGPALDWAVAKAEGLEFVMRSGRPSLVEEFDPELSCNESSLKEWKCWTYYQPSTEWSQGGPLIEKFGVDLSAPPRIDINREIGWQARPDDGETHWHSGETALIAAMRSIVTAKIGHEVEIPGELLDAA